MNLNKNFNKLIEILSSNKYSKILVDIIINGEIPFFDFIKKYLVYISLSGFIIFFEPKFFKDFGEFSFNLLAFILIVSSLLKILPKIKLFKKILILRRQIGIIIGSFLIAHLIGFILVNNINILDFLKQNIFNYSSFLFWGIWGFIFMLFPFLTSNNLSQKLLKRKWIIFQKFTHGFFVLGILHIYFLKGEIEDLFILFIWIVLKILVVKKVVILK